jgi:endonuclease YncB( thermonuclease family)
MAPLGVCHAQMCNDAVIGEGRVTAITDARSFVLDDGREVRLAQIDAPSEEVARRALETMLAGKTISLRGSADPDRYGRLVAFAFESGGAPSVQARLVEAGMALASQARADKRLGGCDSDLRAAEERARQAKIGLWQGSAVIKNAEMPGDILAGLGQFGVVEGTVLSVRQAGGTTYVNFGRQWTRDFAVTISRQRMAAFEAAGFGAKALERRRIRVRGVVEQRGGPRIEATAPEQIEFVNGM